MVESSKSFAFTLLPDYSMSSVLLKKKRIKHWWERSSAHVILAVAHQISCRRQKLHLTWELPRLFKREKLVESVQMTARKHWEGKFFTWRPIGDPEEFSACQPLHKKKTKIRKLWKRPICFQNYLIFFSSQKSFLFCLSCSNVCIKKNNGETVHLVFRQKSEKVDLEQPAYIYHNEICHEGQSIFLFPG